MFEEPLFVLEHSGAPHFTPQLVLAEHLAAFTHEPMIPLEDVELLGPLPAAAQLAFEKLVGQPQPHLERGVGVVAKTEIEVVVEERRAAAERHHAA